MELENIFVSVPLYNDDWSGIGDKAGKMGDRNPWFHMGKLYDLDIHNDAHNPL